MQRRSFAAARQLALAPVILLAALARADPPPPVIRDDDAVQQAVEAARSEFLSRAAFDRLDVEVLLRAADGAWLRGGVGSDTDWYPASCVKLAFAAAAVHWCAAQARPPDCLDAAVRPMLEVSDNFATGVVVDAITGTVNGPPADADYGEWFARRLYTEDLLRSQGLLGDQRLVNKTYPTNSGGMPEGLERLALERHGRNAMDAGGSARLMLAIVSGRFGEPAVEYLRSRLRRPLVSPHSALGGGFPDGTVYESKIGSAYDTLGEVVHAVLPDGRRIVMAVYSNARDPDGPDDQDPGALAGFASLLLGRLPHAAPDE